MKRLYILLSFFLFSTIIVAQPANDDCTSAQVITLSTPAACPDGDGATVSVSGTTIGATASNPYLSLVGCSSGGNQQAPALDVWYSFVATGTLLHLNLNSTFSTPNIALWTGSCANLIGIDCSRGNNAGVLNFTHPALSPGATYFIQISGNTSAAQGNFSFTIDNDMDCNNCVTTASLTGVPAPVNGTYLAGQTVQICFTVNGFNQTSLNWLHGIEYTFGPGWDLTTLTTSTPTECNANPPGPGNASGTWKWFNSVTQSVTPFNVHGPGYFFESDDDAETTNAGNNFGDYTAGACTWTFCITLKVSSTCVNGQGLNITVNTLGDGESGSWTSPACLGDPNFTFNATMSCCTPASATLTQPTCAIPTGTITINTPAPAAGISYSIDGITYANTNGIFAGLIPNTYSVTVKNASGCISAATLYTINAASSVPAAPTATSPQGFCSNTNPTVANLTATGTALQWYTALTGGSPLLSTTALATGAYYVSQTIGGCESARTLVNVTVTSTAAPTATSPQGFCSNTNPTVANLTATGTALQWYSALTGGSPLLSTTALATGAYYVSQTIGGCESARTLVNVTVTSTAAPTATSPQGFCSNTNPTVANLTATGTVLQWYSALTGGSPLLSTTALATGGYYVSQTIGGCESARTLVNVTVTSTAAPTATSPQTFCSNTNPTVANLTATGTALQWYTALTGGSPLLSTTALATGAYYVSQTIGGCESARTLVNVTVTSTAVPTATSPQTFCSNTNPTVANLTATGTALQWYTALTGGSPLLSTTALATGAYYVSQTIGGCESARTLVNVTVTSTAVPTATSPQGFCSNTNPTVANLTATGTALQWYSALTGGSPLLSTTALATGAYYVSQTIGGCESARTLVNVTMNTVTPSVTVIASSTSICSGGSVTFNATPANGGTSPTYQWKINGVNVAGQTSASFTTTSLANGDAVTVVMTSNDACASPTTATSAAINITTSSVTPSVTVIPSSTSICSGSSVTFNATPANGGTSPTYQWKINGVNVAGQTAASFTTTSLVNGDAVTVVMTSNDACANPTTATSTAINITTSSVTPSVTVIPSSTSICSGGSVTFNATPANGGTSPTYQWKINGVNVAGQTSTNFTTTSLVNGDAVTVVMTSSDACANPTTATSTAINITTSSVTPSVTVIPSSTSICSGGSVTFNATPANGGTSPTYQWKINGVNVAGQTSANFTTTSLVNGDAVTVVMTSSDACANPVTATSTAINITTTSVTPLVSVSPTSTSVCSGGSITFTANPTNGGTSPTYQWKINGVNVAGQTSASFTTTSLANGDAVTVVMTSNDACASPATATSTAINITTSSVTPSVTVAPSSTSICSGSSVTFNVTPANGGTSPTYQWKINGVNVAGQTSASFTTTSLANGDAVTVVMTSSDACANPTTATSTAINITTSSVTPSVTVIPSSTSICSGGSVTFNATPANGGTSPTYQWKINGINVAGQTSAIFTTTSLVNGDAVTVVMTSNDACASPATATSTTINITTSSVTPSVTVAPSSTSICSGSSVTFNAMPANGGTSPTYQWKINGVNVAGQTSASFTTTSLVNGDAVTVVMTSNDACASPTTTTSTAINIPVSSPVPGIRYSTVTTIANLPTPLLARTIGINYSYQWVPPIGLDFSDINNPVFNYDKKTEYIITLTSAAGCITVDTLLVDMSNLGNGPYVFVPNVWTPNGDGHNDYLFPFMLNITKLKYFRIFNRWGQKVFETSIPGDGWNGMLSGKPQVMDVYTWTIEAVGTDGSTYKRIGKAALLR